MSEPIFTYSSVKPPADLAWLIDSCWWLEFPGKEPKEVVVLPDGRIDIILSRTVGGDFGIHLMGLGTRADVAVLPPQCSMFAVSFRLPAVEYLLGQSIASLKDAAQPLPEGFWGFFAADMDDFDGFCRKVEAIARRQGLVTMDERKLRLFEKVYALEGAVHIGELSREVYWTSRQINRYCNHWFGVSLKAYCNILRFRASFRHIREGRLFPEQDFADQPHFVREVRKLAGVSPKVLLKNDNDRFVQFSTPE